MSYKGIKFNGKVLDIPQEYLKSVDITNGVLTILDSNGKTHTFTVPEGIATEDFVRQQISSLVNSAPETLDTLGELATAFEENETVVDALNGAIGSKANQSDLNTTNTNVSNLTTTVEGLESNKADKTELEGYLPLSAGSTKKLTNDLYFDNNMVRGIYFKSSTTQGDCGIEAYENNSLCLTGTNAIYLRNNYDGDYVSIENNKLYQNGKEVANKSDLNSYLPKSGGTLDSGLQLGSTASTAIVLPASGKLRAKNTAGTTYDVFRVLSGVADFGATSLQTRFYSKGRPVIYDYSTASSPTAEQIALKKEIPDTSNFADRSEITVLNDRISALESIPQGEVWTTALDLQNISLPVDSYGSIDISSVSDTLSVPNLQALLELLSDKSLVKVTLKCDGSGDSHGEHIVSGIACVEFSKDYYGVTIGKISLILGGQTENSVYISSSSPTGSKDFWVQQASFTLEVYQGMIVDVSATIKGLTYTIDAIAGLKIEYADSAPSTGAEESKFYTHNISIIQNNQAGWVHTSIITNNSTPFTFKTLSQYLFDCGCTSVNRTGYHCSGTFTQLEMSNKRIASALCGINNSDYVSCVGPYSFSDTSYWANSELFSDSSAVLTDSVVEIGSSTAINVGGSGATIKTKSFRMNTQAEATAFYNWALDKCTNASILAVDVSAESYVGQALTTYGLKFSTSTGVTALDSYTKMYHSIYASDPQRYSCSIYWEEGYPYIMLYGGAYNTWKYYYSIGSTGYINYNGVYLNYSSMYTGSAYGSGFTALNGVDTPVTFTVYYIE